MPAAQYTQAPAVGSRVDKPFDQIWVTLTKREHIELVMDAQYWKVAHQRAVAREQWLELQKHQLLASLTQYKAQLRSELEQALALQRQSHQQQLQQGAQQRAELQAQLDVARAQIRDLRQRVFGRKSECSKGANQAQSKGCHKPKSRGQPYGQSGHGRTTQADLPQRHEPRNLATPQCPKFSHGQPSHRLLQDLASHGLIMSAGTLAGGLQKIAALFEPINKAWTTTRQSAICVARWWGVRISLALGLCGQASWLAPCTVCSPLSNSTVSMSASGWVTSCRLALIGVVKRWEMSVHSCLGR